VSTTNTVQELLQSSQFTDGLLLGAAAAVVVRVGDTVVDRIRPGGRGAHRLMGMVALAPPLALVGWVLARRAGLHGVLPEAAVILLVAVGGPLVAVLDADLADGRLTALALTLTAAGVWTCVPDTELARSVLGAGLAATAVWCIGPRRRVGWLAVIVMCTYLGNAIAWGGRGRPASAIGAVACLAPLALLPIASRVLTRWHRSLPSLPVLAIVDVVAVGLASRWVGLMQSTRRATLGALIVLALTTAALWLTSGPSDHRRRAGARPIARQGGRTRR
jgi:hypothetical protein